MFCRGTKHQAVILQTSRRHPGIVNEAAGKIFLSLWASHQNRASRLLLNSDVSDVSLKRDIKSYMR